MNNCQSINEGQSDRPVTSARKRNIAAWLAERGHATDRDSLVRNAYDDVFILHSNDISTIIAITGGHFKTQPRYRICHA